MEGSSAGRLVRASCRACGLSIARARRRAQLRVAPPALAADRSARRRRVRHRALTASAAAAVALGGADRDHPRSAFSVASRADIGGDSPRLSCAVSAPTPASPIASSSSRALSPEKCSACSVLRQIAFLSVPTARQSGRGLRLSQMRAATCCSSARSSHARMSAGCSTHMRGCSHAAPTCSTTRDRRGART